jgi:UDP-N-acetylmuramyl pentapeptide phosphotransferase/UDP-N-acetylglucosamine-1-phosphate transferase
MRITSDFELFILSLISLGASFVVSLLIVQSQRWHGRLSHDEDLGGVQKVHTKAVPRIGGVAVVAGVLFGFLLFKKLYPDELKATRADDVLLLLGASLPAFLSGLVEDVTKRITVKVRLLATLLSAVVASVALGATVSELDIWGLDTLLTLTPLAILFTAIAVAGGANAINIIDGFHGLSGSAIVIMAGGLVVVALQCNDSLVAILGVLCAGATVGFLILNYPFGKLFLGDGGAYFLGFWVAEMAVLLLVRNPTVNSWQVLAICAYPVIEVLFSIYRRSVIMKVSPAKADALHLHALIFRRFVSKYIAHDTVRPWKRNAAVVCVISPILVTCVLVSALAGASTLASIAIVLAQFTLYVAAYSRLVRGRWIGAGRSFDGSAVGVKAQ